MVIAARAVARAGDAAKATRATQVQILRMAPSRFGSILAAVRIEYAGGSALFLGGKSWGGRCPAIVRPAPPAGSPARGGASRSPPPGSPETGAPARRRPAGP